MLAWPQGAYPHQPALSQGAYPHLQLRSQGAYPHLPPHALSASPSRSAQEPQRTNPHLLQVPHARRLLALALGPPWLLLLLNPRSRPGVQLLLRGPVLQWLLLLGPKHVLLLPVPP